MTFSDVFCRDHTGGIAEVQHCYTDEQAQAELRHLFLTRFNAGLTSESLTFSRLIDGEVYVPRIQWDGIEQRNPKNNGEHWLRFTSRNYDTRQASFMGGKAENVGQKMTTVGGVIVQLYFSRPVATAERKAFERVVRNCFVQANTPGGLWLRNANIQNLPDDKDFFRSNVTADYEYDSVVY